MPYINEEGLAAELKTYLSKHKDRVFTCHDLWEVPEISKVAPSMNRVSDYLGDLWRRGYLIRLPSAANSRARWAYKWGPTSQEAAPILPPGKPSRIATTARSDEYIFETPDFVITIRRKDIPVA
jgi:hypothetical protein